MSQVETIGHYSNAIYNLTTLSGYPRIPNREAKTYVARRTPFMGSNLYAVHQGDLYVVYSYGRHFPLAVYDSDTALWYGNSDKYSRSTARHKSHCGHPGEANPHTTSQLINIVMAGGYINAVDCRLAA